MSGRGKAGSAAAVQRMELVTSMPHAACAAEYMQYILARAVMRQTVAQARARTHAYVRVCMPAWVRACVRAGWNTLDTTRDSALLGGVGDGRVYFVHSFRYGQRQARP